MKKFLPIYLYGNTLILAGLFLLLSEPSSLRMISLTTAIILIVGGVLAFFASFAHKRKQVQFAYHEMHSIAMLVYGVLVIWYCTTFELFVTITAFLLLFYAFSEIIFCTWLFNLGQKVMYKIIGVRLILGLTTGLGTVIALNYPNYTLEVFGALFILVGLNVMLYIPVMKRNYDSEIGFLDL